MCGPCAKRAPSGRLAPIGGYRQTRKGHSFTEKENSRSLHVFGADPLDRTAPDRIGSRLHRARDASKLKSSLKAVRGSRKAEGGKSAGTMDESVTGSVNLFLERCWRTWTNLHVKTCFRMNKTALPFNN